MKYTCEITINKNREEVVQLFDSVENLYKWMEGLTKYEHLSGTPGEIGAKAKLTFNFKKRQMEMVETITVKNLPDEFSGTYDAKGVHNIVKNFFQPTPDGKTKYISEQEFHFKGIMKLFGFLMPGAFKKQSMKHLEAFKKFAENT